PEDVHPTVHLRHEILELRWKRVQIGVWDAWHGGGPLLCFPRAADRPPVVQGDGFKCGAACLCWAVWYRSSNGDSAARTTVRRRWRPRAAVRRHGRKRKPLIQRREVRPCQSLRAKPCSPPFAASRTPSGAATWLASA